MKERILCSLIAAMVLSSLRAQVPVQPKLVVGITIDQLRTDYMEAFTALYGQRGFKRLLKEGRVYYNGQYDFVHADASSSVASIYTGTTPSNHGIVGNLWMDRASLRAVRSVEDPAFMGIYTSESSSSHRLLVSTLTDELMQATGGRSQIFAIAPNREMAILSAGHAANGAFWIQDESGKWAGSTYYGNFPQWVNNYNDRQSVDKRIKGLTWRNTLPPLDYKYLSSLIAPAEIKYTFSDNKAEQYKRLKTSPYANEEVNLLVDYLLTHTTVGKDEIPDMLALSYYAGKYGPTPSANVSVEIQDTYMKVDKALGDLLDIIDRKIGLQHTLIFITGTPESPDTTPADTRFRIPTGEFHTERCAALLNMYLTATYGQGKYVEHCYNREIYLNQKLIEDKKLSLETIQKQSADFIARMSGVKAAYAAYDLQHGTWNPLFSRLKAFYHPQRSGDVYIEVMPGWQIINGYDHQTTIAREICSAVPVIFIGYAVQPAILYATVSPSVIAPTVSATLRIRPPNACTLSPLWEVFKYKATNQSFNQQ